MSAYERPLHEMSQTTATDYWNDACAIDELTYGTEDDVAWALIDEMATRAAALLMPTFELTKGATGRLSMQTSAKRHRNPRSMVDQALHFANVIPNLDVKMPVTAAGTEAIEEATARGISVNATVSFTVPQALPWARPSSAATAPACAPPPTATTTSGRSSSAATPSCARWSATCWWRTRTRDGVCA